MSGATQPVVPENATIGELIGLACNFADDQAFATAADILRRAADGLETLAREREAVIASVTGAPR